MIVWVGLLVALASSLVASASKIEFPNDRPAGYKEFVLKNRFPLTTASLAVVGFVVAALAVHEARIEAAEEERKLNQRNELLQSLILFEEAGTPFIRFMWETDDPRIGADWIEEERLWNEGRNHKELPRAIGFFPARVRSELFPNAEPDNLFGYIGAVEVRTGHPSFRPIFRVRRDGTVRNAGQQISRIEQVFMSFYQGSYASFELKMGKRLDADFIFRTLISAHRENSAPLVTRAYGVDSSSRLSDQLSPDFRKSKAKLTFFLDEDKTLGITSMLRGHSVSADGSSLVFQWEFAERPYLEHFYSGGKL